MTGEPRIGQTITIGGGSAYFTRCKRCKRRVMANGTSWAADFAGDSAGQSDHPVLCASCRREIEGKPR